MITRHFYETDAVAEAFLCAVTAYRDPLRKQKLSFWSYELYLSEEWDLLYETLAKAVLKHGAPLVELDRLSTDRQNMDLLRVVLHSLQSLCPLPAPYPKAAGSEELLRRAVQDAVKHRHTERVLRLLGGNPSAVELLAEWCRGRDCGRDCDCCNGKEEEAGLLYMLGTMGLYRVTGAGKSLPAWPPRIPVGRLAARMFSLPRHLLSTQPLHPAAEDLVLRGCAFWRRVIADAPTPVFQTEVPESFYETYFPDDIPDEWSVEEKSKSWKVIL